MTMLESRLRLCSRTGMQLKPECRNNRKHGSTFGITARGVSLIETFPTQSSFPCNLCHAFGTSDITSCSSYQPLISIL